MKKLLIAAIPLMLAGCSTYNQFMERMQTDTLEYQCDEKPLTVHLNNPRQQVNFIYDNQQLNLTQGISGSGARYTDGIYVFWSCLLYTSPSPRDMRRSRMPSSA